MSSSKITLNGYWPQYGFGTPTHIAKKGTQYTDFNTAILYINKDGINTWSQILDDTYPISGGSTTFSGGTVTGPTIFTNGLTANTISATTYQNLPISGLTEGNSISITGSNGNYTISFTGNSSSIFTGGTITGPTIFTNGLTANTISATTYQNLPVSGLTGGNNIGVTNNNSNYTISFTGGTVTASTIFINGLTSNTLNVTGSTILSAVTATTLQFDTTYSGTPNVGQMAWNTDFGVPQVGMLGGNVIQKVGESVYAYVRNDEATTLTKGEVVYIYRATGDKMSVRRASNTGDTTSSKTLGLIAENIVAGGLGYVITQGTLDGLNLGAYSAGTIVWLSSTPGQFTSVKQYAPYHLVFIGVVQRANPGNGQLYVKPQNGYELDELHNVLATGATYGDLITYSAYNGYNLWVNSKTLNGNYTINGNLTVTGNTNLNTVTATTISGVTTFRASSISATTYQNLPISGLTAGSNISITGSNGNYTVSFTGTTGSNFTGGTVTGATIFTNGLSANTISATTYQNLPTDIRVTGGTYTAGTSTFTNNTGGTFSVTGFSKYFVSGSTPSGVTINNGDRWFDTTNGIELVYFNDGDSSQWVQTNDSATITGDYLPINGGTVTGATTFTAGLYSNIISATTYQNLPTDIRVTGSTYSNNTFTYTNNTGGTFNVLFNTLTGLTVNGNLTVTGTTISPTLSGNTLLSRGTYGSVTMNASNNAGMLVFSGSGTVGGTGYTDFIRVVNTVAGATNPNKTIRLNNTGGIEFLNSAYTAQTLSLSDNGILYVGGGNAGTTSSNDGLTNYLSFNNNNSQIYDDGNLHIHSRAANQAMWVNTNGGAMYLLTQSPTTGGALGTGIGIATTTLIGYVTINTGKSYTTSAAYGYLTTGGAGTYPGGSQTVSISLYATARIWAQEIDAFSDERMKDIQGEIELSEAIKLINNLKPIKYTWKEGEDKGLKAGYSAQQVSKAGFDHLIGVLPKEGLEETIDDDGFVSPKDTQFSMNYDQVTPYHGVVIKHLLEEIEKLKNEIKDLQNKIK